MLSELSNIHVLVLLEFFQDKFIGICVNLINFFYCAIDIGALCCQNVLKIAKPFVFFTYLPLQLNDLDLKGIDDLICFLKRV